MKKLICLMSFLLICLCAMAQGTEISSEGSSVIIDVTTFTGVMAVVTMIVTQIAKLVPYIEEHKWAKVLTALGVGIVTTMICWALQVSDFMQDMLWWHALIAGIAVGLSAAGFYDVIKAIWSIFEPKDDGDDDASKLTISVQA